jgi:aminoglycoside phosphotransferase (APT) family kinase protein
MAAAPNVEKLAPKAALTAWLDANVPELGNGPLQTELVSGGTSNVVISIDRGGPRAVLRRPPEVPPPGSEKSVLREARVLTALRGTLVPHPYCYGACADPAVIGAPFYIMQRVEGWSGKIVGDNIVDAPPFDTMPTQYGIGFAMVDGLIALANVDYKAVGLEDFGKADGYLERQVDRWESQLQSYPKLYGYTYRDVPGFTYARDWLRGNIPDDFRPGIIHGDIGTPNVMFAFDRPARLVAMIDWELSTIGDPLIDLAWFTNKLRDETAPDVIPEAALYNVANYPTWQELARYYSAGTGRDMSNYDYYRVLAAYKSGCILEYKVAQSAAGILPPETGVFFDKLVRTAFQRAESICRKAG